MKKCETKYCRKKVNPRTAKKKICGKCASRIQKARYPLHYAYNLLKQNAKRRGKTFTLTLAEFKAFAIASGYAQFRGKTGQSLSINRKRDSEGYSADNIEAVTLAQNTRLYWYQRQAA